MKKKAVQQDPLAEKIEEILTPTLTRCAATNSAKPATSEREPPSIYCRQVSFPARITADEPGATKLPRKTLPSISTAESPIRCTILLPADGITTAQNTKSQRPHWIASSIMKSWTACWFASGMKDFWTAAPMY